VSVISPGDGAAEGDPRGSAVTIGSFDGVHLGHRRLVHELAAVAAERGLRAVVVTFDRHPASVVRPDSAPPLLTDLPQKVELLLGAGADDVRVLPFDEARAAEEAPDFVREVLSAGLSARVVIVGTDFHFGHGRQGNVGLLRKMGADLGFEVMGYELVADPDAAGIVSSTRIRSLLAAGDVEEAARLLGRPHEVRGILAVDAGGAAELHVPPDIALPGAGDYHARLFREPLEEAGDGVAVAASCRRPGGMTLRPVDGGVEWSGGPARVRFVKRAGVAASL
jgi:riboflavin kinase/FMN adenylyltransferase